MDLTLAMGNILSPPILFFFLGMFSVAVKSDLEIPGPLAKFFSLYLLIDIGFRGGHELYENGLTPEILSILAACMVMACVVPVYAFFILKNRFSAADAAAIAATFGSISAVTFITGSTFLDTMHVKAGGYMVAGMALMESPAIIIGVLLFQIFNQREEQKMGIASRKPDWGHLLKEALFNGSILLLVGGMIVGAVSGEHGWKDFKPFDGIFKGILMFYLLDNGIVAAQRLKALRGSVGFMLMFGIAMPLFNAIIGIIISRFILHTSEGDALLFTLLCASASYIAVPAAVRLAIPKSNPAFTVPVALGIVFPFNVIVGIPLYYYIIHTFTV